MRNNRFVKATLVLMLSGLITKILGMIIRVLYTRIIGEEGISLFALVMPTYSLLLTFAVLSMPFAISKLVAEKKTASKKILATASWILLGVNILVLGIVFLTSKFVAVNLLKDQRAYQLIIVASLALPFVSLTSIMKGYFFGRQNMIPNAVSNICEQLVKIGLIIVLLPYFAQKSVIDGVKFLLFTSVITEIVSFFVFWLFLPRNKNIKIQEIKLAKEVGKDLLGISIPSVSGRLIGNIGYFLEPIILTNILLYVGMDRQRIMLDYGAYNAYSVALLLMPAFFIGAIAQSLLPELTRFKANGNYKMVKRRLWQGLLFALIVGMFFSMMIYWWREPLLQILYNTNKGSDFIKALAPFFVLFYLEAPLSSALIAFDKIKAATWISIVGIIIKLTTMSILAFSGMGIYALVYAEIINILFVVLMSFRQLKSYL